MASRTWLAQEAQAPVSQAPVSGQPTGETTMGSSTTNSASTPPGAGKCTPILMDLTCITSESTQEPAYAESLMQLGFLLPAPSVSYSMHQNVNASGNSQPSSIHSVSIDIFVLFILPVLGLISNVFINYIMYPGFCDKVYNHKFFYTNLSTMSFMCSMQVIKSNPAVSSMVVQPPVPGLSSAAPSFSYNISHNVVFPTDQHTQSSNVRIILLINMISCFGGWF